MGVFSVGIFGVFGEEKGISRGLVLVFFGFLVVRVEFWAGEGFKRVL